MTGAVDQQRIVAALAAAADRHWREYIGLLEVSMGRTGSVDRLTPEPIKQERLPT